MSKPIFESGRLTGLSSDLKWLVSPHLRIACPVDLKALKASILEHRPGRVSIDGEPDKSSVLVRRLLREEGFSDTFMAS